MNTDLPPPSLEDRAWMEHWAALEEEAPFPGASGRASRAVDTLKDANDGLTRVTEEARLILSRPGTSRVELMAYLARLREAANDTQRLLPEVAAK